MPLKNGWKCQPFQKSFKKIEKKFKLLLCKETNLLASLFLNTIGMQEANISLLFLEKS